MATWAPTIGTRCCDCGLGTNTAGGRQKWWHSLPGQSVLCVGCLEQRLGRTLCASDFTDAAVNFPDKENVSERMWQRLMATESVPLVPPTPEKRKRGRPKGSKNKPKINDTAQI